MCFAAMISRHCYLVVLLVVWHRFFTVITSPLIYQRMLVWNAWVMLASSWTSQFLLKCLKTNTQLFVCIFSLINVLPFLVGGTSLWTALQGLSMNTSLLYKSVFLSLFSVFFFLVLNFLLNFLQTLYINMNRYL